MSATPMSVESRPFAIEPVTNIMLPDGIFDNALYNLLISCHYSNTSGTDLSNVTLYLESVGDPGIGVTAQTHSFATVKAGASVFVQWVGNFQFASPGKPLVSFVAKADNHSSSRSIRQIFVTQTRYDDVATKWVCTVPEGRLEISNIFAIKPGIDWWPEGDVCCKCPPIPRKPPYPGPHVPTGIKLAWFPNPPFAGQHGDLPYSDPWWKIIALIVAAIAAIVGAIAAALGSGTFSPGVKGKYDDDPNAPSVQCCTPNPGGSVSNNTTTVAGVCGVITSAAIAVACSDAADPIWRGEENTMPQSGELTVSETVDAKWMFVDPPNAGAPYKTKVKWHYERITTGASYGYDVDEEQTNIHVVKNVEVDTPATVTLDEGRLWVRAKFTKADGTLYTGPELFTFCFFRSPDPNSLYFLAPLLDDGLGLDVAANDGTYTAQLSLEVAARYLRKAGDEVEGLWRVYVYAQEVNRTKPGTPPVVAAQTVGGNFVASAVSIKFDPSLPCPFKAQATINVV
jgi:hypothetical protein